MGAFSRFPYFSFSIISLFHKKITLLIFRASRAFILQFLFCYIESDGGGNSFDLEREVRAEFAVDVAFDFFFCAYFDGLCLIILDTFMQANVFAREDTDEKRYEFCPAALIDEYDVEHPVVDLGREDIGEACYGTAERTRNMSTSSLYGTPSISSSISIGRNRGTSPIPRR